MTWRQIGELQFCRSRASIRGDLIPFSSILNVGLYRNRTQQLDDERIIGSRRAHLREGRGLHRSRRVASRRSLAWRWLWQRRLIYWRRRCLKICPWLGRRRGASACGRTATAGASGGGSTGAPLALAAFSAVKAGTPIDVPFSAISGKCRRGGRHDRRPTGGGRQPPTVIRSCSARSGPKRITRPSPPSVVAKLHDAAIKAMNVPSLRSRMEAIGTDLVSADRTGSDYLKRFVSTEIEKCAMPIKASGVSVE